LAKKGNIRKFFMKIKIKDSRKVFFALQSLFCVVFAILVLPRISHAAFDYQLMEQIPGFFNSGSSPTFPQLLTAIYNFGLWTVGIAAFFMLVIGGFLYITSAGNTSAAGTAKKVITDALLGLVAAFLAYLLLYVINPDLVNLNLNLISVGVDYQGVSYNDAQLETSGSGGGGGSCTPMTSGNCSVQNLTAAFGSNASKASGICNAESGGKSTSESGTDRCRGNGTNDSVSIGLFQINISAHRVAGIDCPKAFNRTYTASIAKNQTKCWVVNRPLYNQCVQAAKNPQNNIAIAKQISKNGNTWRQWGANSKCKY